MSFLLFLLAVFATTSGYAFRVPFRALKLTRSSTVMGASRQDPESTTAGNTFSDCGEEVNNMRTFLDLKFGNYSQAKQPFNPATNIVKNPLFHLSRLIKNPYSRLRTGRRNNQRKCITSLSYLLKKVPKRELYH
jgi:hypothetical protein